MLVKPKRNYPKCDRLGTKKDGLKWNWKWWSGPGYYIASAEKTIVVDCKQDVELTCIRLHKKGDKYNYEATVSIGGKIICTLGYEHGFKSRLDAQRAAEELVEKLGRALIEQS